MIARLSIGGGKAETRDSTCVAKSVNTFLVPPLLASLPASFLYSFLFSFSLHSPPVSPSPLPLLPFLHQPFPGRLDYGSHTQPFAFAPVFFPVYSQVEPDSSTGI